MTVPNICSVCAWRATCQKKFSVSGRDARCSDFSEDVSLKKAGEQKEKPAEKGKEAKEGGGA
jgi:hypothetical protein